MTGPQLFMLCLTLIIVSACAMPNEKCDCPEGDAKSCAQPREAPGDSRDVALRAFIKKNFPNLNQDAAEEFRAGMARETPIMEKLMQSFFATGWRESRLGELYDARRKYCVGTVKDCLGKSKSGGEIFIDMTVTGGTLPGKKSFAAVMHELEQSGHGMHAEKSCKYLYQMTVSHSKKQLLYLYCYRYPGISLLSVFGRENAGWMKKP